MIEELRTLKEILDAYNRAITNITVRIKAELAIGNDKISCEELIIELQKAYDDINKTFGESIDKMEANIYDSQES